MRLWSLYPQYLDTKGLTACWREGLLARKVLLGQTKGYRNHPQLIRFRTTADPIAAIDVFLSAILAEAQSRGYNFDGSKINLNAKSEQIAITSGQIEYELEHLKKKLAIRDNQLHAKVATIKKISPNPLFAIVDGEVERWEIV